MNERMHMARSFATLSLPLDDLHAVGKQTQHAGQTILTLTSMHAESGRIQRVLRDLAAFLQSLRDAAEQLDWKGRWRRILSRAFVAFLNGRRLGVPQHKAIGFT
jgi:CubicO group peptidase (beta-lactamase class C family)